MNKSNIVSKDLEHAKQVLLIEATGLTKLSESLDKSLTNAISVIQNITGRVIVTGMGKSGHVAKKIAALINIEAVVIKINIFKSIFNGSIKNKTNEVM